MLYNIKLVWQLYFSILSF